MVSSGRPRVAIGLMLALFTVLGLAAAVPVHAQEQTPALFSAIPEGSQAPPSLDARSAYMVGLGDGRVQCHGAAGRVRSTPPYWETTYTISRDSIDARDGGDYTWFGSGEPRL